MVLLYIDMIYLVKKSNLKNVNMIGMYLKYLHKFNKIVDKLYNTLYLY